MYPNTSKKSSMLEILTECQSATSTGIRLEQVKVNIKPDKETTASSDDIDFFMTQNTNNSLTVCVSKENVEDDNHSKPIENKDIGHINVKPERTSRRDRHAHRIKVRSPKRKPVVEKNICKIKNIGIDAVNWNGYTTEKSTSEVDLSYTQDTDIAEITEAEEQPSSYAIEDMCRICHSGEASSLELGRLISACSCRGTVGRVHVKCLERWLTESGKSRCELCGTKYVTKRVHKFGIIKALAMWILSNNSKHMIVDFFGIMIMTPIAVIAAGLTGRTFAGLMEQNQMTPWPLASTFILACMTLVCYYCWIVSALTRHALGWWIWYRSHYEVRLQWQDSGEHSQESITNCNIYC
ncbi:E3 ubiquitin-protein ligase MARCHF2 [Bicyclus anynana]|uniref:E3 ubiquitin-protein ligase MARCHF2 n=1 Tax=Bicyclus anynana TaxID=110368 RepID=A0A6J1NAC1_BICAN|nr:E3 ubiquitin-protein ligase MARCHF2 [Bicyclus anynana]